jgi:hypothetical protein
MKRRCGFGLHREGVQFRRLAKGFAFRRPVSLHFAARASHGQTGGARRKRLEPIRRGKTGAKQDAAGAVIACIADGQPCASVR